MEPTAFLAWCAALTLGILAVGFALGVTIIFIHSALRAK